MNNRRLQGNILMTIGLLLLAAALFLVARNVYRDIRSGENAANLVDAIHREVLDQLELTTYKPGADWDDLPDYVKFPKMELPIGVIDGKECVGLLQIPAMDKEFPLMEELNDYMLLYGTCRYHGTPYLDNFVIGSHNNSAHFGGLIRYVEEGDSVTFIDMAGNVFNYTVEYIEVLKPYDYYEMIDSEWDLTLFTCTWDLGSRYTVRCMRDNKDVSFVDLG